MNNIIIGADLVPTRSNASLFESGDVNGLLGTELLNLLKAADYRIFNLEVPLTDKPRPIVKCGPNLIAATKCIDGYRAMGVDLLTLANNHILDQGQEGLESTIQILEQMNIAYTGVGNTPEDAKKPFVFKCGGKVIGVYACAEHEFSIVTNYSAGVNPIDWLESPDHVAALKAKCDYVIVLYHGGKEHYRYPSPNLQKICRKLVEKGADLVICQHSHCIGCEEKYLDGTIVYGQGNFLFDDSESEFWQTSLLVALDENFRISYVPLEKKENKVRMAQVEQAKQILKDFKKRNIQIREKDFIESEYAKFAQSMLNGYLATFTGKGSSIVFRVLNKISRRKWIETLSKRLSQKYKIAILNYVECEAHRELFLEGLKNEE